MAIKVFWPDDLPLDTALDLYGWKLADDWYVVAGRIPLDFQPRLSGSGYQDEAPLKLSAFKLGGCMPPMSPMYQYILYKCPNTDRLRFFALHSLQLHPGGEGTDSTGYSASKYLQQMYDQYTCLNDDAASPRSTSHLDKTLALINTVHGARIKFLSAASVGSSIVDTDERGTDFAFLQPAPSAPVSTPSQRFGVPLKLVAALGRLFDISRWELEGSKDFCAVARQMIRRTQELSDLPGEWLAFRGRDISLEEKSRRYIEFYNTVWLIANDLIVGWTISSVLREHFTQVEDLVNQTLSDLFMANIISGLRWLDDWPVGLKLNTPLSRLFCETYIGMANIWQLIISCLPLTTSAIIWSLVYLSLFGASMFISAVSDMVALATLHLRLATRLSGAIYRAEMAALYTLWNLFRGKRWNALRNRVDSYDYEIDQLFLGTLLFTIALFLLPTIATYYLFFAVIRLSLLYLQGANDTALSFINSFPLFALMLRLKEPSRLPGGVSFQLKFHVYTRRPFLRLTSMPIGATLIFSKFVSDWHSLSIGYSPFALMKRLVKGTL